LPSGKPGGQRTYANIAIEAALTIRMVLHLPLRQSEGFLRSLAEKLEAEIPIPDLTTLSRRLRTVGEIRPRTGRQVSRLPLADPLRRRHRGS
ncbi:MAG: hypothetical protein GTO63_02435, partial [Anaerolineae bacterium]|nr:hypothetical protein [Anaerolineae bacterium]NIN93918.1 hypothetical protein [Anaerolineae bacterium]NIQ76949.1 hypothetical protein [Anaerolineae bacterium]